MTKNWIVFVTLWPQWWEPKMTVEKIMLISFYRVLAVSLLGLAFIALTGCGEASDSYLSAADAHAKAQAGEITLVDIREPSEWRQTGVAQNASTISMLHPQGMPGFAQAVHLAAGEDFAAPVVLICRTGSRSGRLVSHLKEMGFENVSHVPEGMLGSSAGPGWVARGLPIKTVP